MLLSLLPFINVSSTMMTMARYIWCLQTRSFSRKEICFTDVAMYEEKERKSSKGKTKVEDNPTAPFQISPMSSFHGMGTRVVKTVRFTPPTVRIISDRKLPKAPLVIITKSAPKETPGTHVIHTKKIGKLVMALVLIFSGNPQWKRFKIFMDLI